MIVKAFVNGLPLENASLRPGKKGYIQHGEVYLLEIDENKMKISSIFKPEVE